MKLEVVQSLPTAPPVIGRCERCVFLKACGGKSAFGEMWNCFDLHPYRANDDDVCPSNSGFAGRVAEVRGLTFDDLPIIAQKRIDLPAYVPHLGHKYCRHLPLQWPVVAITPYDLFRFNNGNYQTVSATGRTLREFFNLAPQTRIILRGTEHDRPLETYWSNRRTGRAPEQLARLGVDLMIAPNFSHFSDATRTDNLFNRKRQLICLSELYDAGLNPVPHLSAAVDADWDFWEGYLKERPTISMVAKELQTGNKPRERGLLCLERMRAIQDRLDRPLHPILIGGAHLAEDAGAHFRSFTILDSRPFQNAVHRHAFRPKGRQQRWTSSQSLPGFGVDDLMLRNFEDYSRWITLRARVKASLRFLGERRTG